MGRTGRQRLHTWERLRGAATLVWLRLVLLILVQLRYLLLQAHLLSLTTLRRQAHIEALVIQRVAVPLLRRMLTVE